MSHRTGSKISKIKAHLNKGLSITPLEALGLYGVFRLASDIEKLRRLDDMDIITDIETAPNGSTYARYYKPTYPYAWMN